MKKFKVIKVGVIFSLLLFLYTNSFAQTFILNDDSLIDNRVKEKITQMGSEVKSKLGVNIYVYAKSSLDLDNNIKTKEKIEAVKLHEKELLKTLQNPYVILTIYMQENIVNLSFSDSLKEIIDKDDILNGYIVPLLASKDKNTLYAKVSAAILNGYSEIADILAKTQNIKLESGIESQGKVAGTIWRVFMYFLVISGILAYTYVVLRKRK